MSVGGRLCLGNAVCISGGGRLYVWGMPSVYLGEAVCMYVWGRPSVWVRAKPDTASASVGDAQCGLVEVTILW